MKLFIVSLAIFVATAAAEFQTRAAVSSLPIGSPEKVLNQYLAHTSQISLSVLVADHLEDLDYGPYSMPFSASWTNYVKLGTTNVESILDLCKRASTTSDKAELRAVLESMTRAALVVAINPNDPALQGKYVDVWVGGVRHFGSWSNNVITISVDSVFRLGDDKDASGNTLIPESVYPVDLSKSLGPNGQGIFFDGGVIVLSGQVKDSQMAVIDSPFVLSWANDVLVFKNEILIGQPGTVELHYSDGTMQIFSLSDGSLVSPIPFVTLTLVSPPAIRLAISNLLPGPVTIKYSTNLMDWVTLSVLTSSTDGTVEVTDTMSSQAKVYRACPGLN